MHMCFHDIHFFILEKPLLDSEWIYAAGTMLAGGTRWELTQSELLQNIEPLAMNAILAREHRIIWELIEAIYFHSFIL